MYLKELKRRATWLWRLSCSRLSEPIISGGCVNALWVFDTAHQPDGGVLKPYMENVARREGLSLRSFGPCHALFGEKFRQLVEFVSRLSCVLRGDFDDEFARLVGDKIRKAVAHEAPSVLLVGASRGTFAAIAGGLNIAAQVWEVQHGLLDQSYFPMIAQRFYARSHVSAQVVEEFAPHVDVEILGRSLDPPEGYIAVADLGLVSELVCFSKNPGGGCTAQDLAIFELACYSAAKHLKRKFILQLHPRDSMLKLFWRHRRLKVLGWIGKHRGPINSRRRLVVSAYSSALITDSREDDLIINVMIDKPSEITLREYQWLPTISVLEMGAIFGNTHVFIRTR